MKPMTSLCLQRPPEAAATIPSAPRGWTVVAVVLLLLISTTPLIAVADLPGETQGTLAAVFPPGTDKARMLTAVAEAQGSILRGGGWGSVLVVHSDQSGFARRLRRAGAWFVLDPQSAAGCLIIDKNKDLPR